MTRVQGDSPRDTRLRSHIKRNEPLHIYGEPNVKPLHGKVSLVEAPLQGE